MGGHHKLPEIPDWRIYRVEDVPELMRVKKNLARHGLSDPWLRNEVWRYQEYGERLNMRYVCKNILFKGFKYGFLAAVVTAGIQHFFSESSKGKGDHN